MTQEQVELLEVLKRIRTLAYGSKFTQADKAILQILRAAEAAITKAEVKEE
jgi:hypothetical protein